MFACGFVMETLSGGRVEMEQQTTVSREIAASDAAAGARLRRTLQGLRSPWVLPQVLLVAASGAVLALWLEIPDKNLAEMTMSFSIAIAGMAGLFWAEGMILTMARRRGGDRPSPWVGALVLAGLALVYWLVSTIFDVGEMRDVRRATAWSLEPGISKVLSEDSLMTMQGALWWTLRFGLMSTLLPFAMEGVATGMRGRWIRRAGWLLLEPLYWTVALGCAGAAALVTEGMLALRPHVPLVAEILLTVMKVMVIFAADVGLLCVVFSLTGTFLRDAQRVMPEAPGARPSSGRRRRP